MNTEQFVENLLTVLPYWQYKLVKPFRNALKTEMGLEAYYALQTLRRSGPMSMTELSRQLKIPKQQATKMIDGLCRQQFVCRKAKDGDRRYVYIEITEEGIQSLFRIFRQDGMFLEKLEAQIGAQELQDLEQAIETLLRVLPKLD